MLSEKLRKPGKYPLHMPGHKRNKKFEINGSDIDITEITGFDNLHSPAGEIKEIEKGFAELYGSARSFLLVNGSTVGILCSIFSVCSEGDKVIVAANCHKSVFSACLLRHLKIITLYPEYDDELGIYKSITQKNLNLLLKKYSPAAVIITSPTYEGYISKIDTGNIPLIVDAAHGAHLIFEPFQKYPKGDIVISSLHKTLPCLTQVAIANIYNKNYAADFKFYLDIFETSSPSYVLMNSASICLEYLKNNRTDFKKLAINCEKLREGNLSKLNIIKNDDISRIVISTYNSNLSGKELFEILRNRYNFECEMFSSHYVIMILTVGDESEVFDEIKSALIKIDDECEIKKNRKIPEPPRSNIIIEPKKSDSFKTTSLKEACGKKANEFVYCYPPDIPILMPGSIIKKENIEFIDNSIKNGINVINDSNSLPLILTKTDE